MDRTARYARCEPPTRSWTLSTTAANGPSQRNKETGEPDDATSILSGSAGGWEKRPKGPRSQPTQLQSSGYPRKAGQLEYGYFGLSHRKGKVRTKIATKNTSYTDVFGLFTPKSYGVFCLAL